MGGRTLCSSVKQPSLTGHTLPWATLSQSTVQSVLQRFAVADAHAGVRRECLMALLSMHRRGLTLEASCYGAADQALDDDHEEVRPTSRF